MTTFDRYVLRNFAFAYFVCFLTTFGLRIVIDLLENIDEFVARAKGQSTQAMLIEMGQYYGCQGLFFFDLAGPTLTVVSAIVVLILFQRSGELYPLLAAGVPMYRAVFAVVVAAAMVNLGLTINQELLIPRVAHLAYSQRGSAADTMHPVEAAYDHSTRISINGAGLNWSRQTIRDAEFLLPAPTLASQMTVLKSAEAIHQPRRGKRPAGWLLKNVVPASGELPLTSAGEQVVHRKPGNPDVFVATPVSCDQLFKRGTSYTMLSTRDLLARLDNPAFGTMSLQRLVQLVHVRLTSPFMNVIAVLITVPLMIRRESTGLVADSALCGLTLAGLFGFSQGCLAMGVAGTLPADVAAWLPLMGGGTLAAWLSGAIRS